jgi:hypothetical protein
MPITKTADVKLNVKPVFIAFYHDYVFEGPCRFGSGEELTKKFDQMTNQEAYRGFMKLVDKNLAGRVNLLPPAFVERNEEFPVSDQMMEEMARDSEKADVYLFGQPAGDYDVILEFAQRYRKPVILTGMALATSTTVAALAARGLEAYPTIDWQDITGQLISSCKKGLKETKVLLAPVGNSNISFSATDSFLSLEKVTEVFGVRFRHVSAHELVDQTRHISPDSNHTLPGRIGLNPTDEDMKKIEEITGSLIDDAIACHMQKEYVFNSVKAYYTVRKFLEHHQCNASPCRSRTVRHKKAERGENNILPYAFASERGGNSIFM